MQTWSTSVVLVHRPLCGPGPWLPPWTTPNFWRCIFTWGLNFKWMILCQFILWEFRLLFLYTCSNFSWIYMGLWVWISQRGLVWKEKQYMKRIWGEVWRRYSLMQVFFWVSLSCMKIDTKMDAQETREEEVMHDDWVSTPNFPFLIALGNVYWLANVLNPGHESSTK